MTGAITSSLRHLRAFQMVAKLRNVGKAAEAVYLTQPAISLAIAKLEDRANSTLFDRRSSGTFLTPTGNLLALRIDRMFQQIEKAFREARIEPDGSGSYIGLACRVSRAQLRALSALANGHVTDGFHDVSRGATLRAVRDLERCLDTDLIRQDVNGPAATDAGRLLAAQLTVALREIDYGIEDIIAESGRQSGCVRVGAMPLSGSFVLAPALNDAVIDFPDAHFEVISGDSGQLHRALLRGEIDLIVGLMLEDSHIEGIETEALASFPYVLVARPSHPLAGKNRLTIDDLESYEWVAPNRHTARRRAFDHLVSKMRRPPNTNVEASSLSTVQILLSGSDKLTLLTRFEFERQHVDGGLISLPIGPIEPTHSLGIGRRENWMPTVLHRNFINLLRSHAVGMATAEKGTVECEISHHVA